MQQLLIDAARQTVAELLNAQGQLITLIPAVGEVTDKPGGGKDYAAAAARDPQTFALRNTKGFDGRENSQTDQGLSRKFAYRLIGAYDAIVEIGDTWEDDAASYTVESVDHTMDHMVQASVTAFLKVTGHGFG